MSNNINAKEWQKVTTVDEIPVLGSRVIRTKAGQIAIFRNSENEIFAVLDKCPHKGGPLSQGIVHGVTVTCPLHAWNIDLATGCAIAPDVGCAKPFITKVESGEVWLNREEIQATHG